MARLPLYLLPIPSFVNCLTCCVAFTEPPKKSCIDKLMKLSFPGLAICYSKNCMGCVRRAGVNAAIVNGQVETL